MWARFSVVASAINACTIIVRDLSGGGKPAEAGLWARFSVVASALNACTVILIVGS